MRISADRNSLVYLYSTSESAFTFGIFNFTNVMRLEIEVASGLYAFQYSNMHIYGLGKGGATITTRSSFTFLESNIHFYGGGGVGTLIQFDNFGTYFLEGANVFFKEMGGGNIVIDCGAYGCEDSTFSLQDFEVCASFSFFFATPSLSFFFFHRAMLCPFRWIALVRILAETRSLHLKKGLWKRLSLAVGTGVVITRLTDAQKPSAI